MSKDGKLFRSSINGFNKDDVNAYIVDQNKRFSDKEADLKEKLNSLTEENKKIAEELSQLRNTQTSLSAEIDSALNYKAMYEELSLKFSEAEKTIQDLGAAQAALSDELEEETKKSELLRNSAAKKDNRIAQLEAAVAELECRCRSNVEAKAESAPYDRLGSQIGDILFNANKAADEVIKEAESVSLSSKKRVQIALDEALKEVKSDIDAGAEACMIDLRTYAHNITESSRVLISDLEKRYEDMVGKITACKDGLNKCVENAINDSTRK